VHLGQKGQIYQLDWWSPFAGLQPQPWLVWFQPDHFLGPNVHLTSHNHWWRVHSNVFGSMFSDFAIIINIIQQYLWCGKSFQVSMPSHALWSHVHNESTCGADASVLRGLMHACTYMCIHIIWAWWLQKSEGQSLCSITQWAWLMTEVRRSVTMLPR